MGGRGLHRIHVIIAMVVWGLSAWSFFPAQQTRLIALAGMELAPVILSLNASLMFAGFSLGAVIGSVTLALGIPGDLGWVGATCVGMALLLAVAARRVSWAGCRVSRCT